MRNTSLFEQSMRYPERPFALRVARCVGYLAIGLFVLSVCTSAGAASTEEVTAQLMPLSLVSARIKSNIGDELAIEFLHMLGLEVMPDRAAPKGRFTDRDVKYILQELDRIVANTTLPIDNLIASIPEEVRSIQVREFAISRERWERLLADPIANAWVKRHNAFQVETASLGYIGIVLWGLAPDKIHFPFVTPTPEYEFLVGHLYAARRQDAYLMLNAPAIVDLLPARIHIQQLRAQEEETRKAAIAVFGRLGYYRGMEDVDGPIFSTSLRVADRLVPQIQQLGVHALEELKQLASQYRRSRSSH